MKNDMENHHTAHECRILQTESYLTVKIGQIYHPAGKNCYTVLSVACGLITLTARFNGP